MKKEIGAYKMYLIVVVVCNALLMLFNILNLISNGLESIVYLIAVTFVSIMNIYCLILSDKNLKLSVQATIFFGIATVFLGLLDGFKLFNDNLRVLVWGPIIYGILLVIKAIKINKNL